MGIQLMGLALGTAQSWSCCRCQCSRPTTVVLCRVFVTAAAARAELIWCQLGSRLLTPVTAAIGVSTATTLSATVEFAGLKMATISVVACRQCQTHPCEVVRCLLGCPLGEVAPHQPRPALPCWTLLTYRAGRTTCSMQGATHCTAQSQG